MIVQALLVAMTAGALALAVLWGVDWRRGVDTRRRGWFLLARHGWATRAGWQWQDRRMRKDR